MAIFLCLAMKGYKIQTRTKHASLCERTFSVSLSVVAFFLAPSSSSPTSTTTCLHSRAHFCLQVLPPKTMREIVHVQAGQCGNQVRRETRRRALCKQSHSAIESNTKFCTFTDLLLPWLALKTILGLPRRLVLSAGAARPPWRIILAPLRTVCPSRGPSVAARRSVRVAHRARWPNFLAHFSPREPHTPCAYFSPVLRLLPRFERQSSLRPRAQWRYCSQQKACASLSYSWLLGRVLPG